ncbi:undecaprenyl-phosphate galactose phosphotransferase [Formivibrio citricus]|uniref:Undecaprenyl-phosphate galactose phosphotransferase n=1 Tax=Formivibrio citricus TaxID=83765 RepID=A0A1I5CB16_9NEIS|nr:undecaprenyl-phosphate galactose phosphotransferase WbaP [Formivibrio citricus]SFN83982.1 undecaprenyl-phosphate galactose phosphotransferase [Formivibrio citricus]
MAIHQRAETAKPWLALADFAALLLAFAGASILLVLLRSHRIRPDIFYWWSAEGSQQALAFLILAVLTVGTFWWRGHYSLRLPFWDELLEILRSLVLAALLNGMVVLFAKWPISRFLWPVSWGLALVLVPLLRSRMKSWLLTMQRWQLPTVIIGCGQNAVEAWRAMRSERLLGFEVRCFVSVDSDAPDRLEVEEGKTLPVVRLSAGELLPWLEQQNHPHVTIAVNEDELRNAQSEIELLSLRYKDMHVIPPLAGLPLFGVTANHFFSHEVLLLRVRNNLASPSLMLLKRVFDFCGAFCGLLMLSPLFAYVAWQIKRQGGPGEVFFGHVRVGMNGKPFKCWKFRTMVHNSKEVLEHLLATSAEARAEWDKDFKLKNDPRITRIGAFLRKTSLDEIPQLWNVLKGEMSLVGPRPIIEAELERYAERVDFYLEARPGLTGLWQVSGRNETTYDERVALDAWYVKNWNLWYDIAILCKTVRTVLTGKGAY